MTNVKQLKQENINKKKETLQQTTTTVLRAPDFVQTRTYRRCGVNHISRIPTNPLTRDSGETEQHKTEL